MDHFPILNKEAVILCESDYLRITGLDEGSLIEITGFSCAKEILNYYGPFCSDHIVIYAGPGKNGADGIATALFLAPHTKKITICMPIQPSHDILNININRAKAFYPNIEFTDVPVSGDIYIDALFGIGLTKKPEGIFEELIQFLNHQPDPIISIDVPSGIDANTSTSAGEVVIPDLTLAIACLKPAHNHQKARSICGEIVCPDIGLPREFIEKYAENHKVAC
jgi:NAD(P)H-hydrate epimerase